MSIPSGADPETMNSTFVGEAGPEDDGAGADGADTAAGDDAAAAGADGWPSLVVAAPTAIISTMSPLSPVRILWRRGHDFRGGWPGGGYGL